MQNLQKMVHCLKLSAPAVDEVDEEKIMNVLSQDAL
jgi:hypothetical protein